MTDHRHPGRIQPRPETQHLFDTIHLLKTERKQCLRGSKRWTEIGVLIGNHSGEIRKIEAGQGAA